MKTRTIRARCFDFDGTLAMMDKNTGTYVALPGLQRLMERLGA